MFGLFKKKTEKEKLLAQYEKLMKESYTLSTIDRKKSDQKVYEAQQIVKQIEKLS